MTPPKRARNTVALVVGHDEKDVGRAFGRNHARRPPRLGILGALFDRFAERHRWRRELLPVDRHSGVGLTGIAADLLRVGGKRGQRTHHGHAQLQYTKDERTQAHYETSLAIHKSP
jgi:hypothetical protein